MTEEQKLKFAAIEMQLKAFGYPDEIIGAVVELLLRSELKT